MLFRHSTTIIESIMRRLVDASAHLQRHDEDSVLDAIDDLESDIARIRSLMFLTKEFDQPPEKYV
jgi:hypothetical protein